MTEQEIQALKDENKYLRKKLQEEQDYQRWVKDHAFNGYTAGYITRCVNSSYIIEHRLAEECEKVKTSIRKLANNPALAMEARNTLDKAVFYVEMYMAYRKHYYDLLDTDKRLRLIEFKKQITKKAGQ